MAKKPNRLDEIEARVKDMLSNHAADIEANGFLRFPAEIILEMDYLVKAARGRLPAVAVESDG